MSAPDTSARPAMAIMRMTVRHVLPGFADQVLPTPRIYARTPFYNRMNNEGAFAQLRLKLHIKVGLRADLHYPAAQRRGPVRLRARR